MNTKCIVALGNPGREYRQTRHNVGQRVFCELEKHSILSWETKQKLCAEICFWVPDGAKSRFMLIKPTVYMNESGKTITNVCTYFDIKSDEILVIHDELDLSIESQEQAKKIIEIMENAVKLTIPNKVDYESGKTWGEING